MSIEAPMSIGAAVSAPAGISIESFGPAMSSPSAGGIDSGLSTFSSLPSIDVGGVNSPELNTDIFSMPQLEVGQISEFDKVFPTEIEFPTDNIWEATPSFEVDSMPYQEFDYDLFDTPQAEIMQEEMFSLSATPDEIKIFNENAVDNSQVQAFEAVMQTEEQLVNNFPDIGEEVASFSEPAAELEVPAIYPATETSTILDTKVISELQEIIDSDEITEPEVKDDSVKTLNLVFQEVEADAQQAARVEGALVAIGIPEEDAKERTSIVLQETLDKKGITKTLTQVQEEELYEASISEGIDKSNDTIDLNTKEKDPNSQSKEKFFERDTNADKAREELAKKAIDILFKKPLFGKKPEVSGDDIAMVMPSRPQPSFIKSEIIQGPFQDGSYKEIITDIALAGEIFSANEATRIVSKAITEKPAVRLREQHTSSTVTIEDVKRVIGEENVLEIKD